MPSSTSGRPPSLDWFDRREPFLDALAAKLEPLEEGAARIETALAAFRKDVRSFAEETGRMLGELEKELIGLRDRVDEHAGRLEQKMGSGFEAVGRADESVRARVEEAERTVGGRVAALEEAALGSIARTAELSEERAAALEGSLLGRVKEVETSLRARMDDVATDLSAAVGTVQARVDRTPVRTEVESLGEALETAAGSLRRAVEDSHQALEFSLSETAERMRADQAKVAGRMPRPVNTSPSACRSPSGSSKRVSLGSAGSPTSSRHSGVSEPSASSSRARPPCGSSKSP